MHLHRFKQFDNPLNRHHWLDRMNGRRAQCWVGAIRDFVVPFAPSSLRRLAPIESGHPGRILYWSGLRRKIHDDVHHESRFLEVEIHVLGIALPATWLLELVCSRFPSRDHLSDQTTLVAHPLQIIH